MGGLEIIQHFCHEIDKNNRIIMTFACVIMKLSHLQSHDNPIFLAFLMILPKFEKNAKQKFGKKGINFGRIFKNARDMLNDIIMYQLNPCWVL